MTTQESPEFPSFHGCTKYTATHKSIPCREAQKLLEWFLHIWQLRKYPQRLRYTLPMSPTSGTVPYSQKGTPTSRFSLGTKGFAPHIQCSNYLACHQGTSSQITQSESQWGLHHKSHRTIANKEAVVNRQGTLPMAILPRLSAEGADKNSLSQLLPERGLTTYFTSS